MLRKRDDNPREEWKYGGGNNIGVQVGTWIDIADVGKQMGQGRSCLMDQINALQVCDGT